MKNINFGHSRIGFFQTRKLTIYKMTSVRKSYSYISKFVKHYYLLTVQQPVLLKIIYDFRIEISFMERMVAVRNYSTNTIMEKNTQGEGGRFKDNGFQG